jgi:hypothetical protein
VKELLKTSMLPVPALLAAYNSVPDPFRHQDTAIALKSIANAHALEAEPLGVGLTAGQEWRNRLDR